jgi:hypothetical protein
MTVSLNEGITNSDKELLEAYTTEYASVERTGAESGVEHNGLYNRGVFTLTCNSHSNYKNT